MFKKGYKQTEQQKRKIGEALRGKPKSEVHRKKLSEISKKLLSREELVRRGFDKTGKQRPESERRKISETMKAKRERLHLWKGGVAVKNRTERMQIMSTFEYRLWREAVFKRDDYTCVWCGGRGVELNADHIKPFYLYPELRLALDNGRTLCVPCHRTRNVYESGE